MSGLRERTRHEMLEKLIRSLPPADVLRFFPLDERLAALPLPLQIKALPDAVLRGFSKDFIRSLPQDVQATIRTQLNEAFKDCDEKLEGLVRSIPREDILRCFTPEEVLASLAAERLAALPLEQQIQVLPDAVLRGLSEDYIHSLPEDVQQVIRGRLDQGK